MSYEYDLYLKTHISNVMNCYEWIRNNLQDVIDKDILDKAFILCSYHDKSKYDAEEYTAYDEYFYGKEKTKDIEDNFNKAWLRHIHMNPHHWQYWILINDDPNLNEICIDMPKEYILEMICDWWSFSWNKENKFELFEFYIKNKDYIKISDNTRFYLHKILSSIEYKLFKNNVN